MSKASHENLQPLLVQSQWKAHIQSPSMAHIQSQQSQPSSGMFTANPDGLSKARLSDPLSLYGEYAIIGGTHFAPAVDDHNVTARLVRAMIVLALRTNHRSSPVIKNMTELSVDLLN
ncbi:hypothetical protein PGTUg99_013250 [Puccinia graminis f. sp. tritici]|uniref:Uncharacterized protein n=1 Tax=Puccinia graminis f. sp. tritici TaxID=56615 RepID=A0A5B0P473_PUCGR|nr:hypothetical protein PGTUg99_013250 [Puccinia graminis f. sp. tritici]